MVRMTCNECVRFENPNRVCSLEILVMGPTVVSESSNIALKVRSSKRQHGTLGQKAVLFTRNESIPLKVDLVKLNTSDVFPNLRRWKVSLRTMRHSFVGPDGVDGAFLEENGKI